MHSCDISCRQIKLLISTTSSTTSPSSLLKHSVLSTHLLLVPQCFEWKNSFRGEEPRLPGHQPSQVQELHSRLPEPFTPNQLGHYRIYLIQTSIHPFDIISLRRTGKAVHTASYSLLSHRRAIRTPWRTSHTPSLRPYLPHRHNVRTAPRISRTLAMALLRAHQVFTRQHPLCHTHARV